MKELGLSEDARSSSVSRSASRLAWLLPVLVLLAYAPLISAEYIWDDPAYVTENELLRTMSGLRTIWLTPGASPQYYPLVFTTFWAEYHLWGLHPLGYHLDNVLLHGFNALLVFRILSGLRVPGALLAAAIFALHPVHVESVAWITERKNVLSGFLYLLSFAAYWRFAAPDGAGNADRKWGWYGWSLVAFVGALLSKSVVASLPAALLVALWWKQGRWHWRQVIPLVPFFVLGIAAGLHTAHLEAGHVGAAGDEWSWSFWERCLIAGRAAWFYAAKLVCPWPLIFIYPKWPIVATDWRQALAPLSVVILLAVLWWGRSRWGRGPLAALLFFGGTLFPALGFVNYYPMRFSFVADHFQYLASLGVIALLAALLAAAWQRRNISRISSFVGSGILLTALGTLSFVRCYAYRNVETLWMATLADNPDCWLAQYHLARVRFEQRRYWEAIELYQKVLAQKLAGKPDPGEMSQLYEWLADSHIATGDTASARRCWRAGLECFQQTLGDPYHDQRAVHFNIAVLHAKLGQTDDAIAAFRQALEFAPDAPDTNFELGSVLLRNERFEESVECFQKVLSSQPQSIPAHYNLAQAHFHRGDRAQARRHLEEALRIQPGFRPAAQLLEQIHAEPSSSHSSGK